MRAYLAYPELKKVDKNNIGFERLWDYQPILKLFGEIILQVDDNDYHGDSRVIYKFRGDEENEYKYGYLQFGWGSCSGCDALKACRTVHEVEDLIDMLDRQTIRFSNAQEALEYFENHDWEGDYSYHTEKQKEFVKRATRLFRSLARKEKRKAKQNKAK